jgi:hypothetical protein
VLRPLTVTASASSDRGGRSRACSTYGGQAQRAGSRARHISGVEGIPVRRPDRYHERVNSARARPPGMVEVGARAGVSYQTVSRVVNGHPSVAVATRKRVEAAIAELEFRPNGAARALATGRGTTVAVLTSNTSLYGYAGTIEGVEQAARSAGLTTTITVLDHKDPEEFARTVDQVLAQPLAGVVALTHDETGISALDLVPPTVVSVGVGGSGSVSRAQAILDERGGAEAATRHLLDLGHRTVEHLAIPDQKNASAREQGWREALRQAEREVPEVISASWLPSSGYEVGPRQADRRDGGAGRQRRPGPGGATWPVRLRPEGPGGRQCDRLRRPALQRLLASGADHGAAELPRAGPDRGGTAARAVRARARDPATRAARHRARAS